MTLRCWSRVFYENWWMADQPEAEQEFHPRGAVAFFASMLVFFGLIWLLFYALMIHRH